MKAIEMPRNLDDPFIVLFWSADELLPGFLMIIVGVLIDQKLLAILAAVALTKVFRKMKEGHPDGFLLHLIYWFGVINLKARTLPNPYIREYLS